MVRKRKNKFWTTWRICFFIIWIGVVIGCGIIIHNNQDQFSFDLSRIATIDNHTYYWQYGELVEPPIAYKIYAWQKEWGTIIGWVAWAWIIVWLILNRNYIESILEGMNE